MNLFSEPSSIQQFTRIAMMVCVVCGTICRQDKSHAESEIVWRYTAASGACEIAAYSAATSRLFVTVGGGVDVVSAKNGTRLGEIAIPPDHHATSIACRDDVVAVAWAADDKHNRGQVIFYDADKLTEIARHEVGYLPDMIVFTPDGSSLLVANEGEPTTDYSFDPEASISIITPGSDWKSAKVTAAFFEEFNEQRKELTAQGVHLAGKNRPTVAEDLEPEYIAVSGDSQTAWITLQENNAIAELDILKAKITRVVPLGFKSFRSLGNASKAKLVSHSTTTGLDANDQDGGARIRHWPVWGMYQPDGIAMFQEGDDNFIVTANEGDPRDYYDFQEAIPAGELATEGIVLDHANPARGLLDDNQLGHLEVLRTAGDTDGDGDLDRLVCPGARSFSIWKCDDKKIEQLFDSGSDIEQIIARVAPELFNADSNLESSIDVRSPIRGPEPENLVVFQVGKRRLVAIGLERTGGVLLYDISEPTEPEFLEYIRPYEGTDNRDLAPEGLTVIPADQRGGRNPLLIVSNEGSGTMTAYEITLNAE